MAGSEPILQNLERYIDLALPEEEAFLACIETRKVRKRQYIAQPGFTCHHQFYVKQGAFRSYFVDLDGVEYTIQLAIDDWFICDFNSYISQQPGSLFVEALEDSVVQQLEYHAVEALCRTHPKFERFFRIAAQKAFAYSQKRILSNLGSTAEARYLEYKKMYPEIVDRVPQYVLASYLGMTPEFFSKMKRRLNPKP